MRSLIVASVLAGAALPAGPAVAQQKQTYNQYTLCAAATGMLRDVSGDTPKAAHYARESKRNYDQAVAVLIERGAAADAAKKTVDDLFGRATTVFKEDIVGSFTQQLGACKDLGLIKMWQ